MAITVIDNKMPPLCNRAYQVRMLFGVPACYSKYRICAFPLQYAQNIGSKIGIYSVIEAEDKPAGFPIGNQPDELFIGIEQFEQFDVLSARRSA